MLGKIRKLLIIFNGSPSTIWSAVTPSQQAGGQAVTPYPNTLIFKLLPAGVYWIILLNGPALPAINPQHAAHLARTPDCSQKTEIAAMPLMGLPPFFHATPR